MMSLQKKQLTTKGLLILMSEVTEIPSENNKTFKLLMVGNSFSADALDWFWMIAESAGVRVIIGEVEIGGCSLQQHWENIENNELAPFNRWDETGKHHQVIPYNDVFGYEEWDVITFQQVSGRSGLYETFQPYLKNLMTYASLFAKNADVKFGWHMTWAYAPNSQHPDFSNYNRDQKTMYDAILAAARQAIADMPIDVVIPSGTSIQNARTHAELKEIGDNMTRDDFHLDLGMGRFTAGLTLFETFLATEYQKDLCVDVSFYPEELGGTEALSLLAKQAVKQAVKNPFKVTQI